MLQVWIALIAHYEARLPAFSLASPIQLTSRSILQDCFILFDRKRCKRKKRERESRDKQSLIVSLLSVAVCTRKRRVRCNRYRPADHLRWILFHSARNSLDVSQWIISFSLGPRNLSVDRIMRPLHILRICFLICFARRNKVWRGFSGCGHADKTSKTKTCFESSRMTFKSLLWSLLASLRLVKLLFTVWTYIIRISRRQRCSRRATTRFMCYSIECKCFLLKKNVKEKFLLVEKPEEDNRAKKISGARVSRILSERHTISDAQF